MQFAVLGPLLVSDDGDGQIPLAAGRLRVLLAALVVRANRVVPVDELAEIVWDGAPPAEAARTVRRYVARLRRALGPAVAARIVTRDPGYVCQAGEDEVDLLRFEALCARGGAAVREGAWARAAGVLGEALGLWRGTPLADADSRALTDAQVPRLEQARLQALEWRIEADLHLGRHGQLVPELTALVGEHPLREHARAQLMLALYRSGRQGEALAAYQDARRTLVAELGVEPAAELRDLHRRMLAADPALKPPSAGDAGGAGARDGSGSAREDARPGNAGLADLAAVVVVPRQLPAAIAHFTGRVSAMEALSRLAAEAAGSDAGGAVVIAAIVGAAGIGKTALAVQWGQQNAGLFPSGQLYVNLRGFDPAGTPVEPGAAIRGFLEALGVPGGRVPAGQDAQAALYRSLVAGRRMLIVLDNARDSEQVRPLLPGSAGCLVLVTSRSQLTGLVAVDGAHPVAVDLFTAGEADDLLARRLGDGRVAAEPAAAGELAGLCARLPLALNVTAARAIARPGVPLAVLAEELRGDQGRLAALEGGNAMASVRAVFSGSLRDLDAATSLFRLAGLHPGPDLDRYAAAALTGSRAEQAVGMLDLLARAHLVHAAGPGRYGMHDLLRVYARELAAARDSDDGEDGQRAALTRLFDHYLHAAAAAMDTLFPAERHRRPRIPPPSSQVPSVAGPSPAREWLDVERANLTAVAAHAVDQGWPVHAIRLAATLSRYLERGGYYPEALTIHASARRAARRLGDKAAEATALTDLGLIDWRQGRHQPAASQFLQALALFREAGDRIGQARALYNLSLVDHGQSRYQEAMGYVQQALALFREAGDRIGEARALGSLGLLAQAQGRYQQAVGYHQQALALFRGIGDRIGEAAALGNLGEVDRQLGRYPQAASYLQQALTLFREIGDRVDEAEILNGLGEIFLATGHPAQARAHHAYALGLARQAGHQVQQARACDGLGRACHAAGDTARARRHWQEALTLYASLGTPEADQIRAQLATDCA